MNIEFNRNFMKCPSFKEEMAKSDQQNNVPPPPVSKAATGSLITLPAFDDAAICDSYVKLLDVRRSIRNYDEARPMTQKELAFMLYTAMGIQAYRGNNAFTLRPAPSGGARHPFELYAAVLNVEGLERGVYRYAPLENVGVKQVAIEYISALEENYKEQISDMLAGQKWGANAGVVLVVTCIPYRCEWRYRQWAHRVALIDLGHVGQNIMLSAEALGLGSCCCAAYVQELCDKAVNVNGDDEYTVYAIPVGAPKPKD